MNQINEIINNILNIISWLHRTFSHFPIKDLENNSNSGFTFDCGPVWQGFSRDYRGAAR